MKHNHIKTVRQCVLDVAPNAYCVRLNDRSGYIVWPGKIQPRGFERPAIGIGTTPNKAWAEALITISATNNLSDPWK